MHDVDSDVLICIVRYIAIGVVGEPNSGKSALVNRMMGVSVAGVSATPDRKRRVGKECRKRW